MKLLKIENSRGHFLSDSGGYQPVDKLNKEDLLRLVELTLGESVEFDEFDEDAIQNQAHQIIYKSVHEKLSDLAERREEFLDESERLYLQDYEKYRGVVDAHADDEPRKNGSKTANRVSSGA